MKLDIFLEKLSVEELEQLHSEAASGRLTERLKAKQRTGESKSCAVCGEQFARNQGFVLEFGDPELRKRAHFCAFDCMEYFINHLKKKGNAYY